MRKYLSTVVDLLKECSAAGVELFLDSGRLRYRAQPGAYTDDLKRQVAACREELIAELAQQPAPIPWHDATPDEHAEIRAALFEGLPVQIYSKVLEEIVWWALDDDVARRLKGGEFVREGYPPYCGEVIYAWSELLAVIGFPPDALKNLHAFKKAFDAKISKPRVVCSACRHLAATSHHCIVKRDLVIANPDCAIECGEYVPAGRRAW